VRESHCINLNTELYFLFETREASSAGQNFLVTSWKQSFSPPTGLVRVTGCLSAKSCHGGSCKIMLSAFILNSKLSNYIYLYLSAERAGFPD
jgi:hypothetical protein